MTFFRPLKVKRAASSPVINCVGQIIRFGHHHKLWAMQVTREYDKTEQWEKVLLRTTDNEWRFVILVFQNALTVTVYQDNQEIAHVTDMHELPDVLQELSGRVIS